MEFLENLDKGYFIQHTLANILLDTDGAQLMCEALYLYGVMLLLLDERIPGPCREKMIIAFFRNKGESALENIDQVCKLCRVTGYIPKLHTRPAQYPERYFRRFQPPAEVVNMIIGKLQSDDVYLQEPSYPHRDHRSTRLAAQASMLYIILFFAPDILIREKATMREIVDRHFNDNFIITTYMGTVVDLSLDWAPYPAARLALQNTLALDNVKLMCKKNAANIDKSLGQLRYFLTEGVLHEQYVLENLESLVNAMRLANVTIRWTILHSRIQGVIPMMMKNSSSSKAGHGKDYHGAKEQRILFEREINPDLVMSLLLETSHLEWKLKQMFEHLLETKEERWQRCMKETSDRMTELSEYYSGDKPLTRVERNDDLVAWFRDLAANVQSLDYVDHVKAGRRIKRLIEALVHVEQFDQIDTSLQVKAFLQEARAYLTEMVRTVRIRDEVMGIIETVSDLSYAWEIINDFMNLLHQRVKRDPGSVILLRAVFLKLASILDVPLTRIHQCASDDVVSVAEYYSGELVDYVRRVMEVIPQSVFRILAGIIKLKTTGMTEVPVKIENLALKKYAQLNERYRLARATNEVSKYTEGILAMKVTLLGIIEVDPRQVLEDGLRKELVYRVSKAFHEVLQFQPQAKQQHHHSDESTKVRTDECQAIFQTLASTLNAYRLSFEYIQDYIGLYGLRIWHEELSRVINYNVEQECNRYLKKKVYDRASTYQSRAIPIPRFNSDSSKEDDASPSSDLSSVNFMGRLMHSLFLLTDPHRMTYSPQHIGWYDESSGQEVCGIGIFSILHRSVGLLGLAGIDRMLSFRIVHTLNNLVKFWTTVVPPYFPLLDQFTTALAPEWKIPDHAQRLYDAALKKVEKLMSKLLKAVLLIGQAALIRRQISSELSFSSRLDANLLSCALDTLNQSLLNDIRAHYRDPKHHPYPKSCSTGGDSSSSSEHNDDDDTDILLVEFNKYLENTGATDPFQKIYITVESSEFEGLAGLLMLFVVAYMPKLEYDPNYAALTRIGKNPLDGTPLVVGILTIFKQFHPSYVRQFLAYLGQYIRAKLNDALDTKNEKEVTTLPHDVLNLLFFLLQFCRYSKIPKSTLHYYVPSYIFDAIQLAI